MPDTSKRGGVPLPPQGSNTKNISMQRDIYGSIWSAMTRVASSYAREHDNRSSVAHWGPQSTALGLAGPQGAWLSAVPASDRPIVVCAREHRGSLRPRWGSGMGQCPKHGGYFML